MSQPSFIHLRLHSEYSIADGMVHIPDAITAAKNNAMPALALTDLSNLFGLIKFYSKARNQGIKPIIGCDMFVSNPAKRDQPYRLLLLCQSNTGYLRLCELITRAFLDNQYRGRPEIERQWLSEGTEGMIALSGAHLGEVGATLLKGNEASARQYAREYAGLFPGRFYLEVQRSGFPRDEAHLRGSLHLAAELGLPVVATHPIQFLSIDDYKAHEARVCIAEGYVLNDKRRAKAFTDQQYFKTQEEMQALFADLPEALQNSVEIAKRCNLTLNLGTNHLPDFPTPNGVTLDAFLRTESEQGLQQRMLHLFPDEAVRTEKMQEYTERLAFEINTIVNMGFPGYFLIVAEFIRWAKAYRSEAFPNGVPVGPGRGSGAGSLVAYSLGITDLDPLRYALLFERFLNPERVSMPDFDVDFCQDGRELVINHVRKKYGAQSVSQIATFGTMASKAVIRDVGRVLDFPYGLCDRLSKLVPLDGVKPVSLKKAREMEPEFNAIISGEEGVEELMELGGRLEDLTRNVGMHAGGVLIAPGKLTDFCPLYCAEGSNSTISQLDKDDVEKIGLVKFDFLGLRTLTIIDWAVRYIQDVKCSMLNAEPHTKVGSQTPNSASSPIDPASFNIEAIPLDDKVTFDLLKASNTTAVFQLESRGMKELIKRLQPDTFEDIVALVALYRPGPLESGMVEDFINRKHGRAKAEYFHPDLEDSLTPTYGVIVYQEQVMQISQIIGGYTLGGADILRRAMGKKDPAEMARQRGLFVDGAIKREIDEKLATQLFDLMENFAGYGFNKSHSAAYALVSYQTAYLKAHYPAAFMASTMSSDMDNTDKVFIAYTNTLQQGVSILAPDVNTSGYRFAPTDKKTITYGLGAVKGTGEAAIINIIKARAGDPFRDLFDFCRRVDKRMVNRRAIEALILSGAFDAILDHRHQLMASLDAALSSADQLARSANQNSLFADDENVSMPVMLANVPRWGMREKLQKEKLALGYYFSGHPYHEYAAELAQFIKLKLCDINPQLVGKSSSTNAGGYTKRNSGVPVLLAGIVSGIRIQQTRRGRMGVITLDDGSNQIEVTVFNEIFESSRPWIKEDKLLVVRGKASLDEYSGNMRISAEALFDLASARSTYAKQLELSISNDKHILVAQLKPLLNPYRDGKCRIVIRYRNITANAQLKLSDEWSVTLHDDLLDELNKLLGVKNVQIRYTA